MNSHRRELILTTLVFLVPVLLHLRTIGFDFIWDDDANVTANAVLFGNDQLRRLWSGQDIYQYYPLTFTSYWLQGRLVGLTPEACHAVNVVLHGLGCAGLYSILRRLAVPGAFWGALLFGVHPVATESVAWITERKNLLAGLFTVGSVRAYLEAAGIGGSRGPRTREPGETRAEPDSARGTRSARTNGLFVLSFLLFVLAVLSKTHVVVLPAFLALLEMWRRGRSGSPPRPDVATSPDAPTRIGARLLPFFAVSAMFSVLTVAFEHRHVVRDGAEWEWAWTLPERIVIAGKVLTFYLAKAVWPHPLAFIYDPWTIDAGRPAEWIPALCWGVGLVLLFTLAVSAGRNRGHAPSVPALPDGRLEPSFYRALFFVAASFVLWLTPVLGFFPVYFHRYALAQDHFAYFALMVLVPGIVAGTTWSLGPLGAGGSEPDPRAIGGVAARSVLAAVACILAALTWHHEADFRNLETLWTRTVEKSPRAWMAWTNLGVLRFGEGRYEEAAADHRRAIGIDARPSEPHNNLGIVLEATGGLGEAIAEYRRATEAEPGNPISFYNLGNALVRAGQLREATRAFEAALQRNPEYPQALNGLGVALAQSGRTQAAAEQWAAALALAPGLLDPYRNLARVLEQEIPIGTGIDMMRRASEATGGTNPAIEVLYSRAWLRMGNFQEATLAVDRAEAAAHGMDVPWLATQILETRLSMTR